MRLPRISGIQAVKILTMFGFVFIRQKGSHMILRKDSITVVVPNHREIDRGTLLNIIRQAGLKKKDFLKLL